MAAVSVKRCIARWKCRMHRHFKNWNDMKHEPRKFWSTKTVFFIYAKLFQYTISDGEAQTPLLRFSGGEGWGGGGGGGCLYTG